MAETVSVRIDKWLWAARFFKTRALAQDAIELGRVRGPAKTAQTLYRETDESQILRERAAMLRKIAQEPAAAIAKGRPTKRDARKIRAFTESGY